MQTCASPGPTQEPSTRPSLWATQNSAPSVVPDPSQSHSQPATPLHSLQGPAGRAQPPHLTARSLPSPPRLQPLASQRPSQSGLSIADPVTLRHLPGKGPTVRTAVPAPRTKRTDGGLGRREELHVSSIERLRGLSSVVSHVPPPAASGLVVRALLVSIDLQERLIRLLPPLLRAFPLIFPPSHSESPSSHHPQRPAPASNDSHF